MTVKKVLTHVVVCLCGIFLLLGITPLSTGALQAWLSGQSLDAITAATTTLDQPSGNYVIYINTDLHDAKSLQTWTTFFTDCDDFSFSMEDVACAVARGDSGAQDMAASFQSQLPEHQMQLTVSDPTMLLSQMANGKYDMVIMSQEFIDAHQNVSGGSNCQVLKVSGAANESSESA